MDNLALSISSNSTTTASDISEEVSSREWELIKLSEDEEDLINKMYRLVGNRWDLIAGRIPGRKAEEIERFWIITHTESFDHKNQQNEAKESPKKGCAKKRCTGW